MHIIDVYIELDAAVPFSAFLRAARTAGLELRDIQKEEQPGNAGDVFAFVVTMKGKTTRKNQEQMTEIISQIPGVKFFEVL